MLICYLCVFLLLVFLLSFYLYLFLWSACFVFFWYVKVLYVVDINPVHVTHISNTSQIVICFKTYLIVPLQLSGSWFELVCTKGKLHWINQTNKEDYSRLLWGRLNPVPQNKRQHVWALEWASGRVQEDLWEGQIPGCDLGCLSVFADWYLLKWGSYPPTETGM